VNNEDMTIKEGYEKVYLRLPNGKLQLALIP